MVEKLIADVEVTVRSPEGLVEMVVTAAGEPRAVAIAAEAFEPARDPFELARSVLDALEGCLERWAVGPDQGLRAPLQL